VPSFIQYSSGSGIDESRSQKGGRKEISRVVTVIIPLRLGGRYHVQGQRHVLQLMRYINSSSEFAFSGLTGWFIGWNVPWVDMSGGIQHPELEVAASCLCLRPLRWLRPVMDQRSLTCILLLVATAGMNLICIYSNFLPTPRREFSKFDKQLALRLSL